MSRIEGLTRFVGAIVGVLIAIGLAVIWMKWSADVEVFGKLFKGKFYVHLKEDIISDTFVESRFLLDEAFQKTALA